MKLLVFTKMKSKTLHPVFLLPFALALQISCARANAAAIDDIATVVAVARSYQSGQSAEALRRLEVLVRQSVGQPKLRKQLETAFVGLLRGEATLEARLFACQQLAILGSADSLPALAELLKHDATVGMACLALTTIPSTQANDILRVALRSARGSQRVQIIQTLGDRRDPIAVVLLAPLAEDPDPATAEAAIVALGKIGSAAAQVVMSRLQQSAPTTLQAVVREASLRIAEQHAASGANRFAAWLYEPLLAASQPVFIRRAALDALLRLDRSRAQERVLEVIRGNDADLNPVAIAAVATLPERNSSEVFARELRNLGPDDQAWLLRSLAVRGDAAARMAITGSLDSPHAVVRRAAISALAQIGDVASVAPLVRALAAASDPDETRAISNALAGLKGGDKTDQALIGSLKAASPEAQPNLINVLAGRRSPAVNSTLLAAAGSGDAAVAKAAFRALGRTASAADLPVLLDKFCALRDRDLRGSVEVSVQQAVANVEPTAQRSAAVCAALDHTSDAERRSALLRLLPACGDARALAATQADAKSAEVSVRDAAITALADWPDAGAWDVLLTVYRQPATEANRGQVLRGLVRLAGDMNKQPDTKLVERYRELLAGAKGDADLKLILSAVSDAAHPDALALVLPLLDKPGVRAEAEVAIRKIAEAVKDQNPQAARDALQRIGKKLERR